MVVTIETYQYNFTVFTGIAGERIWVEVKKILTGRHVGSIMRLMIDLGMGRHIGNLGQLSLYYKLLQIRSFLHVRHHHRTCLDYSEYYSSIGSPFGIFCIHVLRGITSNTPTPTPQTTTLDAVMVSMSVFSAGSE